jgi:serine/threonine protein kinase/Flp pilus assembly protein TadD
MIGKTISHYRILEKLGEGGMGVVYKAVDMRLERTVALKVLLENLKQDVKAGERLIREAKAVARLDHPNICPVYEIDDHGGQTFIAMAYVQGINLREKLLAGPLGVDKALEIAIQVAEGLREAHDRGIVHRDIKSANIMLTSQGRARIMDFGLAKLAGAMEITKPNALVGTIAYMSPEQAAGKPVDHRTDIWSLGVVIYRMLTGERPFKGKTTPEMISSILKDRPQRIRKLREKVPEQLEYSVYKMMQKDRDNRYKDMGALLEDLNRTKSSAVLPLQSSEKSASSIAVLPFSDMSPQKDQEYFCDGLAEEIINALAQLENVRVIARTSAFSFKNTNKDIRDIGRELNVDTVLEGSVRKAGNRLRITGQLINVDDGYHLWSERYDREMDDVFAIQDDITLAIVDKLRIQLLGEEEAIFCKCQTMGFEAYDLYLKGRHFWNKMTEEGLKKAIGYFEQVIGETADSALAYAGLADCYNVLPFFSPISPRETYFKAKEAALKALELDETLGEAHTSLASILVRYEWNWEESEKEHKRAIELNPGYAPAHHFYAMYLMFLGRFQEAIHEIAEAQELDPLSPMVMANFGQILDHAGHTDQAIEKLRKAVSMNPTLPYAHCQLGALHLQNGMSEDGMKEIEKEREISRGRNPVIEAFIGVAYAHLGRIDYAREILESLLHRSKQIYVSPYALARLYLTLGENDEGFSWLDKAYEECDHWLCFLKVHMAHGNTSSDPRYSAMLRKIGLEK